MNKVFHILLTVVLTAFGLLTLFLTSSIIFDLFGIREMEGNYVEFIVHANFLAAFLYLATSVGLALKRPWAIFPISIAAVILVAAAVGLLFYVQAGGIHEKKTIGAMAFRIGVTLIFAVLTYLTVRRKHGKPA